jgi:hypothetical protein
MCVRRPRARVYHRPGPTHLDHLLRWKGRKHDRRPLACARRWFAAAAAAARERTWVPCISKVPSPNPEQCGSPPQRHAPGLLGAGVAAALVGVRSAALPAGTKNSKATRRRCIRSSQSSASSWVKREMVVGVLLLWILKVPSRPLVASTSNPDSDWTMKGPSRPSLSLQVSSRPSPIDF